jgi:hypothetical protein
MRAVADAEFTTRAACIHNSIPGGIAPLLQVRCPWHGHSAGNEEIVTIAALVITFDTWKKTAMH